MNAVRGTVINVHHHGATVRLEDGTLAAVPAAEFSANRVTYVSSHVSRAPLELVLSRRGGHPIVALTSAAPTSDAQAAGGVASSVRLIDAAFEAQMNVFLKASEEPWTAADSAPPAQRHFIRKKRRAALFEARNKGT